MITEITAINDKGQTIKSGVCHKHYQEMEGRPNRGFANNCKVTGEKSIEGKCGDCAIEQLWDDIKTGALDSRCKEY
tara:strand:+ start:47 stop:274 length:228 start_codon:yes stop_codon:yes gene_type:complete